MYYYSSPNQSSLAVVLYWHHRTPSHTAQRRACAIQCIKHSVHEDDTTPAGCTPLATTPFPTLPLYLSPSKGPYTTAPAASMAAGGNQLEKALHASGIDRFIDACESTKQENNPHLAPFLAVPCMHTRSVRHVCSLILSLIHI